jgi:hypothetical protein
MPPCRVVEGNVSHYEDRIWWLRDSGSGFEEARSRKEDNRKEQQSQRLEGLRKDGIVGSTQELLDASNSIINHTISRHESSNNQRREHEPLSKSLLMLKEDHRIGVDQDLS